MADKAIDLGPTGFDPIRKPYRRTGLNKRNRAVLDESGARL
ncbi:hypothetical protein [Sphingomonas sp.]